MRLRGKGVENVNSKRKGDMYVITKVIIPEKLTREQKKLFEELNETTLDNSKEFKIYKNCIKQVQFFSSFVIIKTRNWNQVV